MIYGIIYPPRAGMRSGYIPDDNKTLQEALEEWVKRYGASAETPISVANEYAFNEAFFLSGFKSFINANSGSMRPVPTIEQKLAFVENFMSNVGASVYLDNADRYLAVTDIDRYGRHVKAWGLRTAQKYYTKWLLTRELVTMDDLAVGGVESITEKTERTGNNQSKSMHDNATTGTTSDTLSDTLTKNAATSSTDETTKSGSKTSNNLETVSLKDVETTSGTNTSTANLTNSKSDEELSNNFPVHQTGAGGADAWNNYASGSRKLTSEGTSTGTTTGTASGKKEVSRTGTDNYDLTETTSETNKVESSGTLEDTTTDERTQTGNSQGTDKGTSTRDDTINELDKRTYNRSREEQNELKGDIQRRYYDAVQALADEIARDYGQFFNGDLLAYQL